MSLNKFKISDDLIQNQQFQKKNLTQQIEENTKLQKLHEHFEESCHSEIFSTCRQININNIVTQNNDRSMNYSSIQEDQTPRQNIKNSQTGQLISNSVITNESLIQNKEQSQVKQKSNLSRSQVVNDDRQMTFNEDAQRQSVRSSMRGSYIQKPKQKNEGKVDFSSKTTQFKKDLLKLTHIRKKMMKFFYQNTIFGRTNFLNENHIQPIINDLSDINDKIKISSQRQICIELFSFLEESKFNFLKHIPPFNPQNIIIFFLNTLFCVCNCLFYIVLSIDMIYDAQIPDLIIYTILIVQTIEISVRLNTSVYIQTDYFTDRKIIFMKYLKNECFYDVLPYFFLIMQFSFSDEYNLVLKISSFIKIHNLAKEYKTIHEQISLSTQKYYYYVQLVHLVLSIFLIGHLIACMYYSIGLVEQNVLTIETWFSQGFNADHFIWWRLYLESIYWSLTLMTTGSNVVYTPLQAFFTSFIMLFSTIIFAYFINTIGDILSQKDEEEINQRIDINIINQYMRKRNINKDLQRVINLDIEYFYQKNYKKEEEQNQSVLDKLSINLKEQLHREYYGKILTQIKCLRNNFSQETMDKLSLQMSEAYFLPNQIIFNQENIDFNTLIFVIDGKIELTKQSQTEFGDQTVANISKNEVFGTFSFFTGQPGDLQAKALTFTSIVRVRRDVFQNIIKDHEKDQQQFNLIKDNLLLYNNYEQVNIACSVCQSFKHLTNECNLVHFDKFQFQKKLKFFEKVTQKRTFQNRLRKKALNTLSQINQINQNVQQFEQIHFLSFEEYSQNLTESSNQSDVEENQKQNDEQVQPHKNEPRQSILESLIREEKIARKSKTLADNDKNLKYLSLQNENAREKSSQFLPHQRASVLENLYEIQQAEGINSRTSLRIQKKRERNDQIRFKHDLVSSYQNINSYANVDTAFNIIKISQDNPWLFEKQKDYQFYFPEGNLKMVLIQHNRISKQKQKIFCKSQQKNEEYKTRHKFTKVHD